MSQNNDYIKLVVTAIEKCAKELKIEPGLLQYQDFVRVMTKSIKFGKNFNIEQTKIKAAGGFSNIRDAHFKPSFGEDRLVVTQQAAMNRKKAKSEAAENYYYGKFEEICQKIFKKPIVIVKDIPEKKKISKRHLHLLVSDTHFGSVLDSREGFINFDVLEPSRRMAQIVLQTAEYKPQYRKDTKLFVNLTGDIIQGKLHDKLEGKRISEQKALALYILVQSMGFLASKFPEVEISCVSGNHDRYGEIHPDRAINGKWDSHATDIYFALKMALRNLPNVKVNIPYSSCITYNSFGTNYFGTHGDNMIKIGNPGSSFNVRSLENEVNRRNAALKDSDEFKVVFLGHVHFGALFKLSNGVTVVTNPPLIPSDHFAMSINIPETSTGQWLWESVPGYPVGDSRYLVVDQKTDKDSSLDRIVKPFTDFNDI